MTTITISDKYIQTSQFPAFEKLKQSLPDYEKRIENSFRRALNFFLKNIDFKENPIPINNVTIYLEFDTEEAAAGYSTNDIKMHDVASCNFRFSFNISNKSNILELLNSNSVYATWIHELVHLLDFRKNISYFKKTALQEEDNRLLRFLTEIKIEGTAQIYRLFSGDLPFSVDSLYLKTLFKHQSYYSYTMNDSIFQGYELEKSKSSEVLYGGEATLLLLQAAMNSENSEESAIGFKIYENIIFNDDGSIEIAPCEIEILCQFIRYCINMDLGCFIYRLIHINQPDLSEFVDKQLLFHSLYENEINPLTKRSTVGEICLTDLSLPTFADENMMEFLKENIGGFMDEEEIDENYLTFKTKFEKLNKNDYLSRETLKLTTRLYDIFKSENETEIALSQGVLTYVLDDQDTIYDSTRVYGYLDDLIVLKSFFRIINKYMNL